MEDLHHPGRRIDIQNLLSLGDDLIGVLSTNKDADNLIHCKDGNETLRLSCREDSQEVNNSVEDYLKKINACKDKIEKAKSETVQDAELERLQSDLDGKLQSEFLLRQELREVSDELDALECQRTSFEELKEIVKKREKDVLRAEDLLSMCVSVTNIFPNLDEETRISGVICDKNKKKAEKFEIDPTLTPLMVCDKLWNMAGP